MTSPIQLELFAPPALSATTLQQEWFSRMIPDREGASAFIIMIRGEGDPQPPKKAARHSDRDKAPHLTLRKQSVSQWRERICAVLSDGVARTFNAMCVTIAGLTADICGGEIPEDALWSLVQDGAVEFTTVAPILFRSAAK